MDDDRIVISSGSALTSEAVLNRTFATSFRGYDQAEVRMFLKRIGDELAAAADREAELRKALHDALNRAAHPELDEAVLTNALGEHTARLLTNARETATAVVSDAENRASRILQEGEGRIARMRAEAETLLSRRAEEAERLSSGLRHAADTDARTVRDRARADAQAEVEAARTQGREMLTEAKELRERMLSDLVRRRRLGEAQIQQLRAAHQRLLEAYGVVRRTLEEATAELSAAEAQTRPAADAILTRSAAARGPAPRPPSSAPEFSPHPFPTDPDRPRPGDPSPVATEEPPPSEADSPSPSTPSAPQPGPEPPVDTEGTGPEPTDRREPPVEADGRGAELPVEPVTTGAQRPERTDRAAGVTPAPQVDDPVGVRALGAGHTPSDAPIPDPDRPRAASGGLPPVDLAAPGEEVRVVRDPDEDEAAEGGDEPQGDEAGDPAAQAQAPATDRPGRRSRLRRRTRAEKEAESEQAADKVPEAKKEGQSGGAAAQVEELFARLRSAQARTDAPIDPEALKQAGPVVPAGGRPGTGGDTPESQSPPGQQATAAEVVTDAGPGSKPQVADEKALFRRDELLDPIDSDLSRRLKRVLQDEQNEVLDRLRRQRRPVSEATLPDLVGQTARYQSVAAPLLRQAARSGAGFVSGSSPADLPPDTTADASADGWAADLAVELIVPLRERLERALQEEDTGEEGDNAGVSERLSASYRQWKLQQVEQVARHYSSAAFALGAFGAIDDGATLRWVVDDEGPCPDCEDNALAGPTPKGLLYPTGQSHPPAHPGCRCLLVPTGV